VDWERQEMWFACMPSSNKTTPSEQLQQRRVDCILYYVVCIVGILLQQNIRTWLLLERINMRVLMRNLRMLTSELANSHISIGLSMPSKNKREH
jgi:hypothetical protein